MLRPIGIWNRPKFGFVQPQYLVGVPELCILKPSLVFQIRNKSAIEPNLPAETTTKVRFFLQPFESRFEDAEWHGDTGV